MWLKWPALALSGTLSFFKCWYHLQAQSIFDFLSENAPFNGSLTKKRTTLRLQCTKSREETIETHREYHFTYVWERINIFFTMAIRQQHSFWCRQSQHLFWLSLLFAKNKWNFDVFFYMRAIPPLLKVLIYSYAS